MMINDKILVVGLDSTADSVNLLCQTNVSECANVDHIVDVKCGYDDEGNTEYTVCQREQADGKLMVYSNKNGDTFGLFITKEITESNLLVDLI